TGRDGQGALVADLRPVLDEAALLLHVPSLFLAVILPAFRRRGLDFDVIHLHVGDVAAVGALELLIGHALALRTTQRNTEALAAATSLVAGLRGAEHLEEPSRRVYPEAWGTFASTLTIRGASGSSTTSLNPPLGLRIFAIGRTRCSPAWW